MLQSFPLVRLAALDLDGTLLNRNNEVTLATRQAIARAVEHGVVVVPATGRPLASLPPVVAKLPGIRYAITSNGAAVWDLGDDPMGAVHSRYANAAQRHRTAGTGQKLPVPLLSASGGAAGRRVRWCGAGQRWHSGCAMAS